MKWYFRNVFWVLLLLNVGSWAKRHVIYWNAGMSPELLSKYESHIQHVKIGEFMDILCPQTSLMSITNGPQVIETFDLYNVTKPDFDQCYHGGKNNFIFACDKPEKENKLTIKFQVISPSPLGFRFRYCEDYYFVAVPRGKQSQESGCHSNNSTRLHVKVACKNRPSTTTTTTTSTTITTTTQSSTITRSLESDTEIRLDADDNVIIPNIVRPRPSGRPTSVDQEPDVEAKSQTGGKKDGGNSGCRQFAQTSMYLTMSVISFLMIRALTTTLT